MHSILYMLYVRYSVPNTLYEESTLVDYTLTLCPNSTLTPPELCSSGDDIMSGGSEVIFDDQTRDSDSDLYSELPDSGAGYDNITSARDLQIKEREKLDNKVSVLFF